MTEEELKAIKDRADKASAGPWTCGIPDDEGQIWVDVGDREAATRRFYWHDMEMATGKDLYNAEFIAHAREDVPALIAEVERLNEYVRELEAANYDAYGR